MPKSDGQAHLAYMRERYRRLTPAQRAAKKARDDTRREERLEFLRAYKLEHGCIDCGYAENADALEFDHVRGVKVTTVTSLAGASWDRLLEEVAKCDVRCANCHAIATAERRREAARH